MKIIDLLPWALENPLMAVLAVSLLAALAFFFARNIIGRNLFRLSARTANKYDDLLIRNLRPYRVSLLAPLAIIYIAAPLFPQAQTAIEKTTIVLGLWLVTITLNSVLNAVNDIYESSKSFTGVSIQGYLDIVKILIVLVAGILTITLITGESPWVLLTGLGAIAAVLLLIFQGTILSLVASIQIVANDLIKEGDWIEVPSYDADGDVININLHTIKIQNFDMTYTVIPTYKIVEVAYKNWRGMTESGGRRIQRSIFVDMVSIKFCDTEMIERLCKIDLVNEFVNEKIRKQRAYHREHEGQIDSPLDGPQITNIEVFRAYIQSYLRSRPDIHTEKMPFLVRSLSPTATGLPIELYIFAKTTEWTTYEVIQADIFDHLLAAAPNFDLRVFQEPTGLDFAAFSRALSA